MVQTVGIPSQFFASGGYGENRVGMFSGDDLAAVSVSALLSVPGAEYLALLVPAQRARAYNTLGLFPMYGALRLYVRSRGWNLLSLEACGSIAMYDMDGLHLVLRTSNTKSEDDRKEIWRILLCYDIDMLDCDHMSLMHLEMGDRQFDELLATGDIVQSGGRDGVSDKNSEMVCQYVASTLEDVDGLLSVDERDDSGVVVLEEFVNLTMERYSLVESDFDLDLKVGKVVPSFIDAEKIGYCYLQLFLNEHQFLVASKLGVNPALVDLVDMLVVFYHFGKLKISQSGYAIEHTDSECLHVVPGSLTAVRLMIELIRLKMSGFVGVVGSDVDGTFEEIDNFERVVPTSLQAVVSKKLCDACGFMVNMEGHESRCKTVNQIMSDESIRLKYRRLGWLGDARHHADVRQVLLMEGSGVDAVALESESQKYTAGDKQAAWYTSYLGTKAPLLGDSIRSIATAFEVSYVGDFRKDYMRYLIGNYPRIRVSDDLGESVLNDVSWFRESYGKYSDRSSNLPLGLVGVSGNEISIAKLSYECSTPRVLLPSELTASCVYSLRSWLKGKVDKGVIFLNGEVLVAVGFVKNRKCGCGHTVVSDIDLQNHLLERLHHLRDLYQMICFHRDKDKSELDWTALIKVTGFNLID